VTDSDATTLKARHSFLRRFVMTVWLTQDTVLGTLDQRPHDDARWMMQNQSSAMGVPCMVQMWGDDHDDMVLWRDLWVRNSGQDVQLQDMGVL
jgi:hypothetical protein